MGDLPLQVAVGCGLLAVLYGAWAGKSVLDMSPGNERMQAIAAAIQEGAGAYMNKQYTAIAGVGAILFFVIGFGLGWPSAAGFLVGAVLSSISGFVGMYAVSYTHLRAMPELPVKPLAKVTVI